jgi:hypothetical protein
VYVPASDPLEPFPTGPDPKTWEGPWCSITDPHLIAKYICVENTRQYNQAEGTPFGSGYLGQRAGREASTSDAANILNGTFHLDPHEILLQETHGIIQTLSTPIPLDKMDIETKICPDEIHSNILVSCSLAN